MQKIEALMVGLRNAQQAGDAQAVEIISAALRRAETEQLGNQQVAQRRQGLEEYRAMQPEPERGALSNFGAGAQAGFVGALESAALGVNALADEEAELANREKIQSFASSIKGDGGDEGSISAGLGQAFGSIGALLPAAVAGPAAPVVAGLGALAMGAGEASERARAAGTSEEVRNAATFKGALVGSIDAFPAARLIKTFRRLRGKLPDEVIEDATTKLAKFRQSRTGSASITGAQEGLTEIVGGMAQNLIEQGYNPEKELLDAATLEEGAYGGGAGAILQGILDLMGGRRVKKPTQTPEESAEIEQENEQLLGAEASPEDVMAQAQQAANKLDGTPTGGQPSQEAGIASQVTPSVEPATVTPEGLSPTAVEEQATARKRIARASDLEIPAIERRTGLNALQVDQQLQDNQEFSAKLRPGERISARAKPPKREAIPRNEDLDTPAFSRQRGETAEDSQLEMETRELYAEGERKRPREGELLSSQENMPVVDPRDPDFVERNKQTAPIEGSAQPAPRSRRLPDRSQTIEADDIDVRQQRQRQAFADKAETENKNAPLGLPDKSGTIPLPDRTAELDAQETAERLVREAAGQPLRIEQKDIIFAEDKSGNPETFKVGSAAFAKTPDGDVARVRANGKPFAKESSVKASRLFKLARRNLKNENLEIVPVGDGFGWRYPRTEERLARKNESTAPEQGTLNSPETNQENRATQEPVAPTGKRQYIKGGAPEQGNLPFKKPRRTRAEMAEQRKVKQAEARAKAEAKKPTPAAVEPVAKKELSATSTGAKPKTPKNVPVKEAAPKKAEPKKAEPKKAEPKKAEPKKAEPKKAEPKKPVVGGPLPKAETPAQKAAETKLVTALKAFVKKAPKGSPLAAYIQRWSSNYANLDLVAAAIAHDIVLAPQNKAAARRQGINITKDDYTGLNKEDARLLEAIEETSYSDNAKIALKELQDNGFTELAGSVGQGLRVVNGMAKNLGMISTPNKSSTGVYAKLDTSLINEGKVSGEVTPVPLDSVDGQRVAAEIKVRYLQARVEGILAEIKSAAEDTSSKQSNEVQKEAATYEDEINRIYKEELLLNDNAAMGVSEPLHPGVIQALRQGDMRVALIALSMTSGNAEVRALAKKLIPYAKDVKVSVLMDLAEVGVESKTASGAYSRKRKTVYLSETNGGLNNPLTMLHEMGHAVTLATLDNPAHPVTRQLQRLYDDVLGKISSHYGSKSLAEFVAEAMANPKFGAELAGIRLDKSTNSALTTFLSAVKRLFRTILGSQDPTVKDKADALIEMIIAPPGQESSIGATHSFSQDNSPQAADLILADWGKKLKKINGGAHTKSGDVSNKPFWKKFVTNFDQLVNSGVSNTVKSGIIGMFPLHDLAGLAKHYGFGEVGYKLAAALEVRRGRTQNAEKIVSRKVIEIERMVDKLGSVKETKLNELIYSREFGATIHQVDPMLSKAEAQKKFAKDKSKMDIWTKQQAVRKELGADGDAAFNASRKVYKDLYKQLENVIKSQVETAAKNGSISKADSDSLIAKLFKRGNLPVYFPLVREGRFRVEYAMKDTTVADEKDVRVVETFQSYKEAAEAVKELKANPNVDSVNAPVDGAFDAQAADKARNTTGLVSDILKVMEANKVSSEAQGQVLNLFVDSLPESSMAKAFKKRQGTPGYIPDLMRGLETKAFDISRQTEVFRSSKEISEIGREINEAQEAMDKKTAGLVPSNVVRTELQKRVEFAVAGAKHKNMDNAARILNQTAFVYTIGFNVASTIVNLSQIPMYVLPVVGAQYGYKETTSAIFGAAKWVSGSRKGGLAETKSGKAVEAASLAHGLDSYYDIDDTGNFQIRTDMGLDADQVKELKNMEPLIKLAYERGQLNRSFLNESMGIEQEGRNRKKTAGWVGNLVTSVSAGMFNQAERFNRQTTLLAAYNLHLNELATGTKTKGLPLAERQKMAAEEAITITRQANGGNTLEGAPRWAQEGLGRVALMYKTYGVQMYINMLRMGKDAIRGATEGSPDARKIALRQLGGLHASALMFSGIYGMPIYGAIKAIVDAFRADDEDDFDTMASNYFSEGMFRGGVNTLLAGVGAEVDAGSRMRLTELLFQTNRFNPDASMEESLFYYLGGPGWSTMQRFNRGIKDFGEGNIRRGLEAVLPPAIANVSKTERYASDDGIYTRRLDPIMADLSFGELGAQLIGFTPSEYLRKQEQASRLKGIDNEVQSQRNDIISKLFLADRAMDWGVLDGLYEEMDEFNDRHPAFEIDPKSLETSMDRRKEQSATMHNGVAFSPRFRKTMEEFGGMHDAPYTTK